MDKERAVLSGLEEFVLTFVESEAEPIKSETDNIIESRAIFPSDNNIRDKVTIEKDRIDRYDYLFDMYGYDLKIYFDGVINIIDIKENSLLLKMSESNDGKMIIMLPRNVIDAKQVDGEDD